MQHYSIGAVTKLTQIPAHTLRKWESRHRIAVPLRSPSGRRIYTEAHIETLRLVKQLVANGHALPHLAKLDVDELRQLAAELESKPTSLAVSSVVLVGPNVARLLTNHSLKAERFDGGLDEWLQSKGTGSLSDPIVVENDTLPAPSVDQLIELRGRVDRLIVVYTFASRNTLNTLEDAKIEAVRGPIDDQALLLHLGNVVEPAVHLGLPHRFTSQELARIAVLNPGLQCECPNHIAKLLMDIAAFEKYSTQCIDTDPEEKALHTRLREISEQARALFEDALIAVATADGIHLELRDAHEADR